MVGARLEVALHADLEVERAVARQEIEHVVEEADAGRALARARPVQGQVELQAGTNAHHMIEACFKAFARALRVAVAIDPDEPGVPSTKGTLTE